MVIEPLFVRLQAAWSGNGTSQLDAVGARRIADLLGGVGLYGSMVVGLLLLATHVVAPYIPGWVVCTFLVMLLIETVVKLSLARRYARLFAARRIAAEWRWIVTAGALYSGIVYGASALVLFLPMPADTQMLLAAIYSALLAWAIWGTPQYTACSASMALPMAAPMCAVLLSDNEASSRLLGLLLMVTTLTSLFISRRTGARLVQLIKLDIENRQLLGSLEREKAVTELERERAEQAVIDKSLFIATASHDLRQPLHALCLFQHALANRCTEPKDASLIESIGESSVALMSLLNGLLEVSSLDAHAVDPAWESFQLVELVRRLGREFAPAVAEKGLDMQVDARCSAVLCDELLLTRILRNLLSNAVKFSDSGTVSIQAHDAVDAHGASIVRVLVTDQGSGIATEDVDRVFAEFYRCQSDGATVPDGFGLGLSIVARLCSLLDIELTLESEAGRGTAVQLDILRAPAPPPARPASLGPDEPDRTIAGLRVLVIDGDPAIRAGMQESLQPRGCVVATAANLDEALMQASALVPDVLVCDYLPGSAPDDPTGIDIVETLRRTLDRRLPTAILSAEAIDLPEQDGPHGDIALLRKPVPPSLLHATLHRLRDSEMRTPAHCA